MDEQDAKFDESAPSVIEGTVSIDDVPVLRLDRLSENKDDSLSDIMRSVEKMMFVQTELLTNISNNIEKQVQMATNAQETSSRLGDTTSVSDEDQGEDGSDKTNLLKELGMKLSGGKKGISGLAKILGKVALAATVGPYVFQFIKGFITRSLENLLGISEEAAESVAGPLSMGVLFGGIAKFFGFKFFPALIGGITFGLVKKLDIDGDGEIAGMSSNIVAGLAAGIATTLSYFHKWTFGMLKKGFGKIGNGVRSLMGSKVKVDDIIPDVKPTAATVKPGAKPTKLPALPKPQPLPSPKPIPVPKGVEKLKIPSGLRVNPAGNVPPNTAKGVMQSLKDSGRLAQLAKYSKFLRFAGPAMAVIPALIEPIQAIYNDEPGEVIATQVSGALGSIGGGLLGSMAGAAMGTVGIPIPFVGSIAGGLFGGIAGALGGEALIETLTGFLLDNTALNADDAKPKSVGGRTGSIAQAKQGKPSENASAKISSSTDYGALELADAKEESTASAKALSDFKSTAKSGKMVEVTDPDFGDTMSQLTFDDPEEQAKYNALRAADFDTQVKTDMARQSLVEDSTFGNTMSFLRDKDITENGREYTIVRGVLQSGPLKGKHIDDLVDEYAMNEKSKDDAAMGITSTPARSPEIKDDTAGAEKRHSVMTKSGMKKLTKAEIQKGKKDGSIKRSLATSALRTISMEERRADLGKSPSSDKLSTKAQTISENKMSEAGSNSNTIQNNIAKSGDTVTSTNVGGSSTTFNIMKGGGGSLANGHLPVPMG